MIRKGRNKTEMIPFLANHGIRISPLVVFSRKDPLVNIQRQMKKLGDGLWILKPDALAAKIGVRKIKDIAQFYCRL